MTGGAEESIEAAAAARRERLKALREAQELLYTPDEDVAAADFGKPPKVNTGRDGDHDGAKDSEHEEQLDKEEDEEAEDVNMKFRNYLPHDKQLQEGKVAPPVLPKFEDPVLAAPPPVEKTEDPFLNIAPKKPNWDLRRDVQKKLDKLERRTQKAMLILMEKEEEQRRVGESDGTNDREGAETG